MIPASRVTWMTLRPKMRKSDPQRVENFVRAARKQLENPDLPDDLRAKYQAVVDKGEVLEILQNAMDKKLRRARPQGRA